MIYNDNDIIIKNYRINSSREIIQNATSHVSQGYARIDDVLENTSD